MNVPCLFHKVDPVISCRIIFLFFLALSPQLFAGKPKPFKGKHSAEIQLALNKLNVLGSALYIAAHPDDENTAVLAYLANENLVRTAYLSLTRGDGGQNLIGTEKGELLGILRTQELLAARQIDGAEQYFTRAIDFGYSKSAEETLDIWDKEKVLSDIVWVIRAFRPDIIITRFTSKLGGHGHHLASAILAEEAFNAAADPSRYPEQLSSVRPWQAKRLVWNKFTDSEHKTESLSNSVKLDVGKFNSLLGKSYTELAAESRSMHKCQGFGSSAYRGSKFEYFEHVLGEPFNGDLFDGIELSWGRVHGGETLRKIISRAVDTFNPEKPTEVLPLLVAACKLLNESTPHYWITEKRKEVINLIKQCSGLWIEAIADDYAVTRGNNLDITAMVVNRTGYPMTLERIMVPFGNADISSSQPLQINQPHSIKRSILVPSNSEYSEPYWLREEPEHGIYPVRHQALIGLSNISPLPTVKFMVLIGNERVELETPIYFRWTDSIEGETYRPVVITPNVTVNLEEKVYIFSDSQPKKIRLSIKSPINRFYGKLHVRLSGGWNTDNEVIPFEIREFGEEINQSITIRPSSTSSIGTITIEVEREGKTSLARSHRIIQYPHIQVQNYFPVAKAKLIRLNISMRGGKIGYIMGAGDEIPNVLQQLGYQVHLLTDNEIGTINLSIFDAIITGIRAYNTRECLRNYHHRLLEYVHAGGTLLDQYNTSGDLVIDNPGPYPFTISRDRVTMEDTPVKILTPDHRLLNRPNKITPADFEGWTQERGLYFPNQWDSKYETILACHDPGEREKQGGILYCRYGEGVYIYTSYSWFRQLPGGVPGAYRLFVNLLSSTR